MLYVHLRVTASKNRIKTLELVVYHNSERLFGKKYAGEDEKKYLMEFNETLKELKKYDKITLLVWDRKDYEMILWRMMKHGIRSVGIKTASLINK